MGRGNQYTQLAKHLKLQLLTIGKGPVTLSQMHTDIGNGSINGNCQGSRANRGVWWGRNVEKGSDLWMHLF